MATYQLLAKEQFCYPATKPLFAKLEQLSQRSSVSRGVAFEDFLTAMVCALAAETKEDEYLAMIERHKHGKPGKRGADLMAEMFGDLVNAMGDADADILGDLFSGAVTYAESGQYFSPESVARLLAEMSVDPDARPTAERPLLVSDPCCGTGRMLLAAANVNPRVQLVGQDIDARCVKITSINMGLRGRYGWVVCGNSLTGETQFAYRVGSFFNETPQGLRRGVIRDVPPEETPVPVIGERMRKDTHGLFEADDTPAAQPDVAMPTIIEVPQWLSRLEEKLAVGDRDEPEAAEPSTKHADDRLGDPPPKQGELF